MSYRHKYRFNKIYKYIIESDDKKILYIFKQIYNICWNIILYKLMKHRKYKMILSVILDNKILMNIKMLTERQFVDLIMYDITINLDIIDNIITNNLKDKIQIYCKYGLITDNLIKIILDKYYNYDINDFIKQIYKIDNEFIEKIVKCKKIQYIRSIIDKCSMELISKIFECSLINNFQESIDLCLKAGVNYMNILDKLMIK